MDQGFYYIIPAKLAEGGDHLKALLYGLITSLTSAEGYCWATNDYLAKKLGRKSGRIIRGAITELENEGWIVSVVDKDKGNKRRITLAVGAMAELRHRSGEITPDPSGGITPHSITTESNQKELDTAAPNGAEVGELIDVFKKSVNPTISFGHKTYRKASEELITQFGLDVALRAARFAVKIHGEQFAPVIGNPYQLKLKWPELLAYAKKHNTQKVGFAG